MESNIVIFGEVLFDRFPDGKRVLGGAPFNVAWHLQGFGLSPSFLSRIGTDASGDEVLSTMSAWGMDTSSVQRDPEHPTGTVDVSIQAGQPSFNIVADQAYDFIEYDPIHFVPEILYFGTLAARSPVSSATLATLIETSGAQRFVDVNLRSPWWNYAQVVQALDHARYAKLNDEELITLSKQPVATESLITKAQALREQFDLVLLILTLGADGACFISENDVQQAASAPVNKLVDTVGAGDAFSAVTLLGLIREWPLAKTLQRALEFASRICEQRGATARDSALYGDCLARWQA